MYVVNTFLILITFFAIVNILFNLWFVLKIKKISKDKECHFFYNKNSKINLIIINSLLILLFSSSLFLDIFSMRVVKNGHLIAYFLIFTNLSYFFLSTFNFWFSYELYKNVIIAFSKDEFFNLFTKINITDIKKIEDYGNKIIIYYGKYNDLIKIKTSNSENKKQILELLNGNF